MKKRNLKTDTNPAPEKQEPVPSQKDEIKKEAQNNDGGRKNPETKDPLAEAENSSEKTSVEPEKAPEETEAPASDETASSSEEREPAQRPLKRGRVLAGRLLMVLGLLLLLGAGFLYFYNQKEAMDAAENSAEMLPDVQLAISEKVREVQLQDEAVPEVTEHVNPYDVEAVEKSQEMTIYVKNGWSYIGYVVIPKLNLELPVLSEISQYNLGMAPCRHLGSTKSDDLVLAAHNYPFHFGRIKELAQGDEVSFIDMDGVLSTYEVVTVGVIKDTDIDLVTDPSLDLTLYTCTYGGENRIMVGCQRVTEES